MYMLYLTANVHVRTSIQDELYKNYVRGYKVEDEVFEVFLYCTRQRGSIYQTTHLTSLLSLPQHKERAINDRDMGHFQHTFGTSGRISYLEYTHHSMCISE